MKKIVLFISFLLILNAAAHETHVLDVPQLPISIGIGEEIIELEAYIYRDFMPISPPDGKPMCGLVTLKTKSGNAVPKGITVISIRISHKKKSWSAKMKMDPNFNRKNVNVRVDGGPKWQTGIMIDITVYLKYNGREYLLQLEKRKLHKTS